MKQPLVSVIIPIYNIEGYVGQAINSLLNQKIDFHKNIQLILVDDGSTDDSSSVCLNYAKKYSKNITYIHQKNSGVSAARNVGLAKATGKYVHFFDGDDALSKNFYSETVHFLEKNEDEIDFVAVKLKFFDAVIDSHPLNYKFSSTRVIDLEAEPDAPILHMVSCVFKRSAIKDMRFDERLAISEDVAFVSDVLVKKKKYGVVKSPVYYYRKRGNDSSAIGGKEFNRGYYIDTPEYAYEPMFKQWELSGNSHPIEYTLLYDISYRLKQKDVQILNDKEAAQYKQKIRRLLGKFSPKVVANHRQLSIHEKMYVLSCIYGDAISKHINNKDNIIYVDDYVLYDLRKNLVFYDFITQENDGKYKIEGYIDGYVSTDMSFRISVSDRNYGMTFVPRKQRVESFLGDVYNDGGAFEVSIDVLHPGEKMKLILGGLTLPVKTGRFTGLASYRYSYRKNEKNIITKSLRTVTFYNNSKPLHILLDIRQGLLIAAHWNITVVTQRAKALFSRNLAQLSWKSRAIEIVKPLLFMFEMVAMMPRAAFLRITYYILEIFRRKPVWIVSDRGMSAGDNGEAIFRYIMSQKDCPADVFFAISKQSKDYSRLKKVGPILSYGGLKYKLKFLQADKIISSHADVEVTNPFLRQLDHFVDLFTFDFVFLQHGIIRNDLSDWLNRFDKDIKLFITSSRREYQSLLDYPYYYPKKSLLLSGMPRYDYLNNNPQGTVVIMPTYRNSLLRLNTDKYGVRPYDDQFKKSQYYAFYNQLINDTEIITAMKKARLSGELYIHPNFAAQLSDFKGNEIVKVMTYPYDYKKALSRGELLISDYSSVVLDFAYMKKPVLYAQFDASDFFRHQPYNKGDFFSDEVDGFGPIANSYDELKKTMIKMIRSGIVMDEKYKKRVDDFFAYGDSASSERVYAALVYNE